VCAEGFSLPLTIGLVAWGVAISLFIGYTLFRWRRFVGTKSDSDHGEFAAMIRKRFTWASMITYCLLAPFSWLFILAMAFCSGNH
jgi:hypothetical protein